MMDSDKNTWVNNVALKQWLAPHLTTGGVLVSKKVAEKTQILKEYFKAAAAVWPRAWGDLKSYNLCRPMGFEILIGLFGPVKHRCDLNCGRQYTRENFSSQVAGASADSMRSNHLSELGGRNGEQRRRF